MSRHWLGSFLRRDLMRTLRLIFLLALSATSLVFLVQVAHMGVGPGVTAMSAAVLLGALCLRVVEFRRQRPVPVWLDVLELAAVFLVLSQVTAVHPAISIFFMSLLCRSMVGRLPHLFRLQAGYLTIWSVAAAVFVPVVAVPGAMISLPLVSLLVYGSRVLMLRVQEQQEARNALLAGVLGELPFPVVVVDDAGAVVLANAAVRDLIGWRRPGLPELGELRLEDLEERPVDVAGLLCASAEPARLDARLIRRNGSTREVKVQTVPMAGAFGAGGGLVLALLDVTAQRLYQQHLHRAAYFDLLTGLPNRRLLFERMHLAHDSGMPYAMLLIDLNDFKAVNDTRGHKIGDELLAGVADRLSGALGEQATVARLGGDEFAVLLPHAGPAEARAAAEVVRGAFTAPLPLTCGPLAASGTVGFAVSAPGRSPDQVMEQADAAMYALKPHSRRRSRGARAEAVA